MPADPITTLTVIETPDDDLHLAFSATDCSGIDGEPRGQVDLPEPMSLTDTVSWLADDETAPEHFEGVATRQEYKQIRRDVRNSAWYEGNDDEPARY